MPQAYCGGRPVNLAPSLSSPTLSRCLTRFSSRWSWSVPPLTPSSGFRETKYRARLNKRSSTTPSFHRTKEVGPRRSGSRTTVVVSGKNGGRGTYRSPSSTVRPSVERGEISGLSGFRSFLLRDLCSETDPGPPLPSFRYPGNPSSSQPSPSLSSSGSGAAWGSIVSVEETDVTTRRTRTG